MIEVQRVDYIRIPVTNMEKADHFYGEVLGLERNPKSPSEDWVEYETGNVTLALMTPHSHDYEFTPLPSGTIASGAGEVPNRCPADCFEPGAFAPRSAHQRRTPSPSASFVPCAPSATTGC